MILILIEMFFFIILLETKQPVFVYIQAAKILMEEFLYLHCYCPANEAVK